MVALHISPERVIQEKSFNGATSVISVLMLLIKKKNQKSNVFYVVTVFMIFYIFMYFMRFFFHHILSLTALVSTQRMSLFIIGAVF